MTDDPDRTEVGSRVWWWRRWRAAGRKRKAEGVSNEDVRRSLKAVALFWLVSLLVMAVGVGYAVHVSVSNRADQDRKNTQASYDNQFRQAVGNRQVTLSGCKHQNAHRRVERGILKRGLRSSFTLYKTGGITATIYRLVQKQNNRAIAELSRRHCRRQVARIPIPEPPVGVKRHRVPVGVSTDGT